jgi:hypothetical protein
MLIQEKEREQMARKALDEEGGENGNALSQASSGTIHRRCSSCGLEWESAHYGEACPLRELETAFLSADWFMFASETTSSSRQKVRWNA